MGNPLEQFRDAMIREGLSPPDRIEPGRFQRYPGFGKERRNTAGWCRLFADGRGGIFGDFSTGLVETWQAKLTRPLSLEEREAFRRNVEESKAQADAEREKTHANAAYRGAEIWAAADRAPADHSYLVAKKIEPHSARIYKGELVIAGMPCDGALVIALWRDGEVKTLEFISPAGDKRFLPGGAKLGAYASIGKAGDIICLAEGWATAATIHEATGYAVAAAMDADSMGSVGEALRAKYPDATIVVCADDDYLTAGNPGITKARAAAEAISGYLAVPEFGPDRQPGQTDFNDAGAETTKRAIDAALNGKVCEAQPSGPSASEADLSGPSWPDALDPVAMHGIAGEFVRMVEPQSESDPAALLVQFLAAFGALVGRGPHYLVEKDQHHVNLFVLLVGDSAKGRKGTSWGRIRDVFERIDDHWKPQVSGMSSGEGIKFHVRDAREETKPDRNGQSVTEIVDSGVSDKRLFVVESEFASVLRNVQRNGNTLSATIREAWDSGNLRTLTKNDPVVATGAHVCIVAHITGDELRSELTATDTANGFANRFLFVAVRRSKFLPFGGELADEGELRAFADRLRTLAITARQRGRVTMTDDARAEWASLYPTLSQGVDGLHGAVTARAEAQTVRLALIYALLDGASQINVPHLMAALAVWCYCDATALYVFGDSLGDRTADDLIRQLRHAGDQGMDRTAIRDHFGRHQSAERISAALELLKTRGMVVCETGSPGPAGGRPRELWRSTK